MVDWLAFTVTADGWFNCGLVWEKRRGACISARVFVSVCTCASERTWGGDSRYLRPTDRHLALHQPSTARPYGMLRNVTSWHRQRTLRVCICVCVLGVSVYVCLCNTSSSSVWVCLYCARTTWAGADENCVKYTTAALWLLFFFFYHCSLTQAATHTNK